MSMVCWMMSLSPAQIHALRENPSVASDLAAVAEDDGEETLHKMLMARLSPEKRANAEARFQEFGELRAHVAEARARLADFGALEPPLHLGKSWHILHYLFTGNVGPVNSAGDALLTGEDLGEDFTGYGPPRLHDALATRHFADFLETLDLVSLQTRMNYEKMTGIGVYSVPMGRGAEAEFETGFRAEVSSCFPSLRAYVMNAAEKQNGLLVWLT